ncbi:MAG: 5-(carboxyamino)imidazole ribonucleotide mutase [Oscillospiraceae bacterium]|jgi:5-(carboxyamino)imidazole ribonucleotide mutase|nr:5-(carboxyamino)imidazole ribonucleotide mutase [Oscillospiraceae bacterium]
MSVPKVAVILGSASDWDAARPCVDTLRSLGIAADVRVMSAHRTPQDVAVFAQGARAAGYSVLIAAAGKAAHLAGAVAARTTLPVIGIPMQSSLMGGLDALLSTAQMPAGIPVATVAVGGAENAALLAAQILAVTDASLADTLEEHRRRLARAVADADAALQTRLQGGAQGGST